MTTKETGGPAELLCALQSPQDMDAYLELHTGAEIIAHIKAIQSPERTLRDWFAGQALAGPVASRVVRYGADEVAYLGGTEWMAGLAYDIADSMLKARGE